MTGGQFDPICHIPSCDETAIEPGGYCPSHDRELEAEVSEL